MLIEPRFVYRMISIFHKLFVYHEYNNKPDVKLMQILEIFNVAAYLHFCIVH